MRPALLWATVAISAALVALLAYGVAAQGGDTSIDQALVDGKRIEAPVATLPGLGDEARRQSLTNYRGKVVVLNFWASWCKPCVEELPLLQQTHERIADRGATVLGVNYQDLPEKSLPFYRRFGLTFPSVRDRDGEYADEFGTRAMPETFVIDRRGRIGAVRRGPVTREWLDRTLAPLLQETP